VDGGDPLQGDDLAAVDALHPHFTTGKDYTHRIIGIPDEGMNIPLGQSKIKAVPAHFMHSEGNFQFYDPVSKILFSGDMGASLVDHARPRSRCATSTTTC
jgi:flavorubredoxin